MKSENTFIIHPETTEQENALKAFVKALKMKFEVAKEKPYDPDFFFRFIYPLIICLKYLSKSKL